MRISTYFCCLLLFILLIIGCGGNDKKEAFVFTEVTKSRIADGAKEHQIKITYPAITESDYFSTNELINLIIEREVIAVTGYNAVTIPELIDTFMRDAEEESEYLPEGMSYALEVNGLVKMNTRKVVTIIITCYSFTGGAHPNTATSIISCNPEDASLYTFDTFFNDEEKLRLREIIEGMVREKFEIEDGTDLHEFGFYHDEDLIPLPSQMGISKEGLLLLYNPYEIAPYVMGEVSLLIPNAVLKKEFGKKRFL